MEACTRECLAFNRFLASTDVNGISEGSHFSGKQDVFEAEVALFWMGLT